MASLSGWFRPTVRPARLIVRSGLHYFGEHWLDSHGSSARCLGDGCELCALYPVRPVACLAVQPERDSRVFLLKIPGDAGEFANQLEQMDEELVGVCLRVSRVSKDVADGLCLELDGREFARAVPVSKYVSAIGRRLYDEAVLALQAAPPLALAK
jgi:hypothetical protein